jgi:rhamnosyltransferase
MGKDVKKVSIVMRSYNDVGVIRQTLQAVKSQTFKDFDLWNFDSTSNDGTLEIIREYNVPECIKLNDSANYNPGRILNEAVAACTGEIIVFINSDATPTSSTWLEDLIKPFNDPEVGTVYGRQVARPDCRSLFVKDTERAFGDGKVANSWVHFFSMANSAIRRDLVETVPFETRIQYSEDIEWSYRVKRMGKKVVYVPSAEAMHSHNYTIKQSYKRHFGEGMADSWIFRRGEVNSSLLRYFLAPAVMEIFRDMVWGIRTGSVDALIHSVPLRVTQKWARWRGYAQGRRVYGAG